MQRFAKLFLLAIGLSMALPSQASVFTWYWFKSIKCIEWPQPGPSPIKWRYYEADIECIPYDLPDPSPCPFPGPCPPFPPIFEVAYEVPIIYENLPRTIWIEILLDGIPIEVPILLGISDSSVAAEAQAQFPADSGNVWVGYQIPLDNVPMTGGTMTFRSTLLWQDLPAGTPNLVHSIFASDNADQQPELSVNNGYVQAPWTASVLQEASIGTHFSFDQFKGTGFAPNPTINQLNSDYWEILGLTDGPLPFGGIGITGDFARGGSSGNETVGGVYGFENDSIDPGNSIRGLMLKPSLGDLSPGSLTTRLLNDSDTTLRSVLVQIDALTNNIDFGNGLTASLFHSKDGTTFLPVPGAVIQSNPSSSMVGEGYIRHIRNFHITGLNIPAQGLLYLRWNIQSTTGFPFGVHDEFVLNHLRTTNTTKNCSSAQAPLEPTSVVGEETTALAWKPIEGSIGCRISAERLDPLGPTPSITLPGNELSHYSFPTSVLGDSTTWRWNVSCACSTTAPYDIGPASVNDTFTYSVVAADETVLERENDVLLSPHNVELWPNPASGFVQFTVDGSFAIEHIRVVNASGETVLARMRLNNPTTIGFNVSKWPQGVYHLMINDRMAKRFVVTH